MNLRRKNVGFEKTWPTRAREGGAETAVVYVRVSSDAQVDGTSLDTQREACRSCAKRLGLTVLSEHEDAGKSAKSVVGRDALAAAMDEATKSGSALIVYKFDRLSRNLGDGYDLRDVLVAKGCRIISATEGEASATPVSKAMFAMMMAFAELDNDMRTERCHGGMIARAKQGGWNSNPPIGFKLSRNASRITILVPDGVQSEILRPAFIDFVTGKITKSGLIGRLKQAGHPDSTITRIIRSPVYGGIIRNALTDWEDVPAAFPGLITADQYYIMEAKLKGNKRVSLKDNPAFPYTGTVICGVCGNAVRSGFTHSKGKTFGYYFCRDAGHVKIKREDLHAQVDHMLSDLSVMHDFLELLKRNILERKLSDDPEKAETARHERTISRIEPQLVKLRSAFLDGTFTRDEYESEGARLRAMLAEAREWIDAHKEVKDKRAEYLDMMIGLFADPQKVLARFTVAQTKSLIRILFGKFTLTHEKRIEPSQDSVYTALTTVQTDLLKDGRPYGAKIETLLWPFAEQLAALLRTA